MWSLEYGKRLIHTPGQIASFSGDDLEGLGVTKNGQLVKWIIGAPKIVEGQTGVKLVSDEYWLKKDGTIWNVSGKVKGFSDVRLMDSDKYNLAALTEDGKLLAKEPMREVKTLAVLPNASSIQDLITSDDRIAVRYDNGKVVVYEKFNYSDDGGIIPVTVAHDAVDIKYTTGDPTVALIVTRKDGTVWTTGKYQERWRLVRQVPGLSDIVRTASYKNVNHFFAQTSSGDWLMFADEEVTPFEAPLVETLDVSVTELKPYVGGNLEVHVQETYSNGAKINFQAGAANIKVHSPHLLRVEPDGSITALGVGQSNVSVSSGGKTQTFPISSSLYNNLTFSKLQHGTVFVPARAVTEALGGKLSVADGGLEVTIGEAKVWFKVGELSAKMNGNAIQLQAAPFIEKGTTMIPAKLLTQLMNVNVKWDNEWKQVHLSMGDAQMTVVSNETAGLLKKAAQGHLANYIGKSYWVNQLSDYERFMKVTVTDIVPKDTGSFIIEFKSASGEQLEGIDASLSYAEHLLSDGTALLTFNPYQTYNWSASTWSLIKNRNVALGMTKDQVRMSWGNPYTTSIAKMGGDIIETWVYSDFDTVSFVNGNVTLIIE